MKRNEKLIKTKLWQYLLPSIMMTAALQMGNIVDTMLVGNIMGADAMSAVKIGMTIDNIMEIPGYVLGVGGSVAVGILLGKREREKADRVYSVTLTISLICGFIFALLSVASPALADMLTGGNSLTDDVSGFVFVTLLGAPVLSLALQFMNYVAVDNNPSAASAYVIVSNIINLVLDYFILKYTALGTAGAALSTILGYGLAMVVLIAYFRSPKRMLRFVNPFKNTKGEFILAVSTGIPTLLYMIFETIKDLGLNTIIVRVIGNDAMAVYTICINVVLMVELIVGGIIGTIASIGGVIYGEKDYFGIKSLVKNVLKYSYSVLAIVLIILFCFTDYVVALFGISGGELLDICIKSLRIFIGCLPIYLLNKFMTTYYQSTEKTKLSGIVTSLQNCIVILPVAAAFIFVAKIAGFDMLNALMISFIVSELLTAVIVFIYRKIKYKHQGILLLPDMEDENILDISIDGNVEDAEKIPRKIIDFCNEKGVDGSKANLLAVAAEEMIFNIIKYGGKRVNTIDVNLCITKDSIIFRIRDNGIPFDPTDYSVDSGDFEIHGIEVVKSITDRIQYMRVLDLNNSVVEIGMKSSM
ncbi:MAG: ATP-binding protein [Lachnospiraceae bacterium]|nr:ATP-binding protein [Lachnospiraceae bacterium]